tara:strand:- start:3434 stop:4015 length:582 start_codon:yes stop_codon:yes gene_type:complete
MNRETYLNKATELLKVGTFKRADLVIPHDVKISCGFPPTGNTRNNNKTLGVCHNRESSKAKVNEIFISPVISESLRVLDILAHELIHAIDDCKNGHKKAFRDMAISIGLEGKSMTSTHAGERLKQDLSKIINRLGEYPHQKVSLAANRKKQGTRMLKVSCNNCEFSYRTSNKNINMMTNKVCNSCGKESLEVV